MAIISPYDFPEKLTDFALIPDFATKIEELAALAEPEDWTFHNSPASEQKPVLSNYIRYTYKRLAEEKKIEITQDEKSAALNTGLVTPNQEPIFLLFEENHLPDRRSFWHFQKWARKGQWDVNKFAKLPEMAHYFDDPSLLVYDYRRELRANYEHIIEDNRVRFPKEFNTMNNYMLQNIVKGAIDSVIERVKRNYKTAIPHYYNGQLQLLLPLCLQDQTKADLALVVERFPDFYRAATCLPLDLAYNNARQLAKPDKDWLQP